MNTKTNKPQTIKEIRENMCLSQGQFAEYFEIPLGT